MSWGRTRCPNTDYVMSEDGDLETVASLLDDRYAREILAAASVERMSATTLSERCDAARATVYDRTERLCEAGLLTARQEFDPDGHHYKTYETRLEHVSITLDDGVYRVEVTKTDSDPVDRFSDLVDGLK
jgi:predicted transcriptional regulator